MVDIAIIPARAGSKRLPGKNIKTLAGKPLIAWTIEAAIDSDCFDRIIVSTDDQVIGDVAIEYGAEVPFIRPSEYSGDLTSSSQVIEHAVTWLEKHEEINVETITLLQPTSPLRNAQHIRDCFGLMYEKSADGIVSVTPVETKLELCNKLPEDRSLAGFISDEKQRTQDMEQLYELNGAIYLFKRHIVGSLNSMYTFQSNSYAYLMQPTDSVDIDTMFDFCWAEFLINNKKL